MGSSNKRASKGKSKGKGGGGAPPPAKIASQLIEAVGFGAHEELLAAELAAARLTADAYPHYWAEDDPELATRPVTAMLTLLQHLRNEDLLDDALAVVLALRSLDPSDPDVREQGDEAAKRLRFLRAGAPAWDTETIGRPEFVRASVVRDAWGELETFGLTFRYPGEDEHAIEFDYDRDAGGELVDALVVVDASDRTRTGVDISVEEALLHLVDGLEGVDATQGDFLSEDGLDVLALLESRARLLLETVDPETWDERGSSPYASELDDLDDGAAVLEAFLASAEFAAETDADRATAERVVRFVDGIAAGGVARIGPRLATGALLVAVPGRDLDEATAARMATSGPATVRAWVRFAARHRGLEGAALDACLAAIDGADVRAEFAQRLANPPLPTLDERLFELLDEDGVDAHDEGAVTRWYSAFEALPDAEREQRLGPLADDAPPARD